MSVDRWWAESSDERYFLETTDRTGVGVDLSDRLGVLLVWPPGFGRLEKL
jgi:hypothetical protein